MLFSVVNQSLNVLTKVAACSRSFCLYQFSPEVMEMMRVAEKAREELEKKASFPVLKKEDVKSNDKHPKSQECNQAFFSSSDGSKCLKKENQGSQKVDCHHKFSVGC
jgi:hypothetical protein